MTEPAEPTNIGYISIKNITARSVGQMELDPAIPLPVELPEDRSRWSAQNISWEAIVAAMLRLLALDPGREHADYYRQFVLAARPAIKEELTHTGILKARDGELPVAAEIFQALAGLFPDCALTRNNLALVYAQQAEKARQVEDQQECDRASALAFHEFKSAVAADPALAATHLNFAHFYLGGWNLVKAREHLEEFLRLNTDPEKDREVRKLRDKLAFQDRMEELFKEAYDAVQLGHEQEAIEKITAFLEHNSGVWNAWFLLGWAHRRLEHYQEARTAFQRSLELNPDHADTRNELAICHMELGDLEASEGQLKAALRLDGDNGKIISNLGILALRRGEREKALAFFQTVLVKDPRDPIALRYVEQLQSN